jgi:uncharacterized protein (TIGR02266 family)
MSSTKTILIAHRHAAVRERFAAALADARHEFVLAETAEEARRAAAGTSAPISLALIDLGLSGDGAGLVRALREAAGRQMPVAVFAGTVASAIDIPALVALQVVGYVNEHAATSQILPALAPHLFPDNFDRRASPRVALGVSVSYRTGATIAAARALNVGRGGLAIRTMTPLAAETVVQLKFSLPGHPDEIEASGRVAWSDRRVGMGIQFERIEGEGQVLVDDFVETYR